MHLCERVLLAWARGVRAVCDAQVENRVLACKDNTQPGAGQEGEAGTGKHGVA